MSNLNNTSSNSVITGSSNVTTGSPSILNNSQSFGYPASNLTTGIISVNGTAFSTILKPIETKKNIKHVILKKDGTALELVEQQSISLREMIGICKFISLVASMSTSVGLAVNIQWSELIKNLNIENHFQPLTTVRDPDSFYIELRDPL